MAINPNVVGQVANSKAAKWLGIGFLASTIDDVIRGVKEGISGLGIFGGPGGIATKGLENLKQTELFSGTVTGVRNMFVGITEFFKIIGDLIQGKISLGAIMRGEISASEAFSSANGRTQDDHTAPSSLDNALAAVNPINPDGTVSGKTLAADAAGLGAAGVLVYGGYKGIKALPKIMPAMTDEKKLETLTRERDILKTEREIEELKNPKDPNGHKGGNNKVTLGHDTESNGSRPNGPPNGGSGGSTPGGNGGGDAPRGGNGGGSTTVRTSPASETGFKAASGAGIEAAETGAKHSRSGKLGLAATLGIGGLAAYEMVNPAQGKTAELDQPTAAPATPAAPNLSTSENLMLGAMTAEAAYGAGKGASLIASKGLGFVAKEGFEIAGKRIPVVGGFVTAAFGLAAAGTYAGNGQYLKAATEAGTTIVESLLNGTGIGLVGGSDGAREAIRSGVIALAGEENAPDKSGLRTVIEYATGTGDFKAAAAAPAQTASVGQLKDAVANSEISTAEVSLDGLSGEFTSSAMMPVPAPSGGGIDLSSMDNNKKHKSKHPSLDATIG